MRGPKGTEVTITIWREEEPKPFDVQLIRDTIPIDSVRSALIQDGFGYVRVTNFREKTTDDQKQNLDFSDAEKAKAIAQAHAEKQAKDEAEELKKELGDAIGKGLLEVEGFNDRVLIRIRERGSFGSGKADLKTEFAPILLQIAQVLKQRNGHFIIAGHTDDIPIETKQFRSNWELSAKRAATVVHFFIQQGDIDPERMEIRAHSDNLPIVPNDSWENRAKNRRVEISVLHGNFKSIDLESPSDDVDFVQD
jgi:chemotaxis protein MotB